MYEKRIKGGQKRKHKLGGWPEPVNLSQARALALELEAEAARGFDRIAQAESRRLTEEAAASRVLSVGLSIDTYHDLHLSGLRTGSERRRQLEVALHGHLEKKVTELDRSDFQQAIDMKAREGRLVAANRTRAALTAFSRCCWKRGYIADDVGASVGKATRETVRERVLFLTEVRAIWDATLGELRCREWWLLPVDAGGHGSGNQDGRVD